MIQASVGHGPAMARAFARAFEIAATPPLEWRGSSLEIQSALDAEVMIAGPAETSKAQPDDAIVFCPSGPRRIDSLAVGDEVLNADGGVGVVTGVFPRGVEEVYRLTFSDGASAESTLDHLWEVSSCNGSYEWSDGVMTLAQIIDRYETWDQQDRRKRVAVPIPKPLQFEAQPVSVDPYVMGALLGDGHISPGVISISSTDVEVLDRVRSGLGDRYELRHTSRCDYGIRAKSFRPKRSSTAKPGYARWNGHSFVAMGRRPGGRGAKYLGSFRTMADAEAAVAQHAPHAFSEGDVNGDGLWNDMARYGLMGRLGREKFVPQEYLTNSVDVRLGVLQGLMDTDGTVDKRGSASFSSTSKRLAEDVAWLVRSLGGFAKLSEYANAFGPVYTLRVAFDAPRMLFGLKRKAERLRVARAGKPLRRFIDSIEPVRHSSVRCISVEGSRSLYVTNDFVVTHNTYACCFRLHQLARSTPGAHGAIIRKVRKDMGTSVLRTWERIIARDGGCVPYGGSHQTAYVYDNGTVIDVLGLDRAEKVLSAEFDWVYVNQAEELSEEEWAMVGSRCTGRGAVTEHPQIFGDCNPGPPSHWILSRKSLRKLYSYHKDNPSLYTADGQLTKQGERTMGILENLPGVMRDRLLLGRWVQAEGVVYKDFDRGVHVLTLADMRKRGWIPSSYDGDTLPRNWTRFASIDFGFTDPFVWLVFALDPDGRMYLEHEMYMTQRLVEDHAKKARELVKEWGIDISMTVCDHDAEGRGTWERHFGQSTTLANKSIEDGIQKVIARLRPAGDGRPRLFFMADALVEPDSELTVKHVPHRTTDEFGVYAWPDVKDGTGKKAETPIDKWNHGCDAARYAVMARDFSDDEADLSPYDIDEVNPFAGDRASF